jgi:hypothetical protein
MTDYEAKYNKTIKFLQDLVTEADEWSDDLAPQEVIANRGLIQKFNGSVFIQN